MQLQLLTMIPALAAIVWALVVKFKAGQIFDAVVILVCTVALAANALVVYNIVIQNSCPLPLHFIQLLFSSSIVPLAYMYFSRQMGRAWNNATAMVCWLLILLVLLPNLNIFLGAEWILYNPSQILPFTVNIIYDGVISFTCYTADLVIFLQAMLTVARMIPTAITLKRYGLILSPKMLGFFFWWIGAVLFIIYTSFISTATLVSPVGSWIYFVLYSLLICSIFAMLALKLDLNPVILTKDEGEPVAVDAFIDASKAMAERLRRLMEEDKIYLQSGYTAEDAVAALGTNRTYFSRMMNAEFGMKFSDMITDYRINLAKKLLTTTDMSISDVAMEAGFSDASYMSRKFHQVVGVTPHAYRAG